MSWPAVRTEPVRLREAGLRPFWNDAWLAALGAPLLFQLLGGATLALLALAQDGWEVGFGHLLELPGAILASTLFLAIAGLIVSLPVWPAAIALAALAARTGWAGWLVALAGGGLLGLGWATLMQALGGQSLEWQSIHLTSGILGLLYSAVFWLAVRWTAPDLLRGRKPITTP